MKKPIITFSLMAMTLPLMSMPSNAQVLYHDTYNNDGLENNTRRGGGLRLNNISNATWEDSGRIVFTPGNANFRRRAIVYSENAFQSDQGLNLTVRYNLDQVTPTAGHNLSFGLVRADTNLASYGGFNPFREDASTYSIGVNLVGSGSDPSSHGLTFSNGSNSRNLDQAGTNAFITSGGSRIVGFTVGQGGAWSYTIDGELEATGTIPGGFDTNASYHIVAYAQDDNGGVKSIETMTLTSATPDVQDFYPEFLYHDGFDTDGLNTNIIKGGGLINVGNSGGRWIENSDQAIYVRNGQNPDNKAILYSENSFNSETGFKLRVSYETDLIGRSGQHNLSFGLVSSDTDLANYDGSNPFDSQRGVYGIGANITTGGRTAARGLTFGNGTNTPATILDTAGSRQQFTRNRPSEVEIEIGRYGYWSYRINGEYEASGALPEDFDLSKDYHIVVFGQDVENGSKSIQSITLEEGYDQGDRAVSLRGSWNSGQGDSDFLQNLKTVDSTLARVNEGAALSAEHNLPHRLLEMIAAGESSVGGNPINHVVHPTWGNFNHDEPDTDYFLQDISGIRNAGLGAKFYSNSQNFIGGNDADDLAPFVQRWFQWCDTNPEAVAFLNSQPYYKGVWNRNTQQYEDASNQFPRRKYLFCYAEFVLKDIALRYGEYATSWTFDFSSPTFGNDAGDNPLSGIHQEQRLYQAYANAVWAGNPDCPVAFNNGRQPNNGFNNDPAFPFALPTRFEDFTFGHAHGANQDHASKTRTSPVRANETFFTSNERHVTRMTQTNGFVHAGGDRSFDDKVVGNFHSKLGPVSWRFSLPVAWTQNDFNRLNLLAIRSGGHMTWEGAVARSFVPRPLNSSNLQPLQTEAANFLTNTDNFLAANETPDGPSWARAFTDLPAATVGQNYFHRLNIGEDLYDLNNDIIEVTAKRDGFFSNVPSWLVIFRNNVGDWILRGIPENPSAQVNEFNLVVRNSNNITASRKVTIRVNGADGNVDFEPITE